MEKTIYTSLHSFLADLLSKPRPKQTISFFVNGKLTSYSISSFFDLVSSKAKEFEASTASSFALINEDEFTNAVDTLALLSLHKRITILPSSLPLQDLKNALVASESEELVLGDGLFEDDEKEELSSKLHTKSDFSFHRDHGDFIFFTSGTTSFNKPVLLNEESFFRSAYNGQCMLPCSEADTIASFLPLSHVYGFVCSFLWPLLYGASIVFVSIKESIFSLSSIKPTILVLVPSFVPLFMKNGSINHECHTILVGAGPLPREEIFAIKKSGIRLAYGYGLSETASGVAISVGSDDPSLLSPCPEDSFKLSKEGTLLIKSSSIMEGYFNNPKATADSFEDGYLKTNDLAEIKEDGRIKILGRRDDMASLRNGLKVDLSSLEFDIAPLLIGVDFAIGCHHGNLYLFYFNKGDASLKVRKALLDYNAKNPFRHEIRFSVPLESPIPRTMVGKIKRYLLKY